MNYRVYDTDFCNICICESFGRISHITFGNHPPAQAIRDTARFSDKETPLIERTAIQISQYLLGRRTDFTIPLFTQGTDFQRKVWITMAQIPFGTTCSYEKLAKAVGSPNSYRAIHIASKTNPISIIIPTHRVTKRDGELPAHSENDDIKSIMNTLLTMERRRSVQRNPSQHYYDRRDR